MRDDFARWASSYESHIDTPLARLMGGGSPHDFNHLKCEDVLRTLRAYGQNPSHLTLLDLGCGTGLTEKMLHGQFRRLIAADISEPMLQEARRKNLAHVEWIQADAAHIPLADASADVALAMGLLHHAHGASLKKILDEARRCLSPGGFLALYEHNPWNPITRWVVSRSPVDTDIEWMSPKRLRSAAQEAGFEVLATRFLFFFPRFLKPLLPLERFMTWLPMGGQYVLWAQKKK